MKIAISGKGGVGKTTITAILATELKKQKKVLVIDVDPSPHMARTLGIENPEKITPIAEMTTLLAERSGKVEGSPMYNLNPQISDLPEKFMLEKDGVKLMVLGAIQTAQGGCACPENTVLKRLLTKLLLNPSETVLLDMEAGVEHLGRGTVAGVDVLLIVVTPSKSSIRTAEKIRKMALDSGILRIYFIGNMVEDQEDISFLNEGLSVEMLGFFPASKAIRKAERSGRAIIEEESEEEQKAAREIITCLLK
ncbi:MAG: P-loop NTPase [Thermodesulfobacteriota bacterium]